jgi:tRNA pseudouridine38-40 synthase
MRYFIRVSYKGTRYAGFQIQHKADTIQGQLERALATVCRTTISLTGSSRTDAGVHALENYFHFDLEVDFSAAAVYNLNAILPSDIVVRSVIPVPSDAHCRYLATSREYHYHITTFKDPFSTETAWYYPYSFDFDLLNTAAKVLFQYTDYTTFSKRNTGSLTKKCTIVNSEWTFNGGILTYKVEANRFLRGMVRGLVGTMLLVGRKKVALADFETIIQAKDCTKANFATPAHGLFLVKVQYPFNGNDQDMHESV